MNNEEQQATTEFLRIAEGMVRYVDKECSVEGSGKAVLCVSEDKYLRENINKMINYLEGKE